MSWFFVGQLGKYVPGGIWPVVGQAELARRGGTTRGIAYSATAMSMVATFLGAATVAAVTGLIAPTDGDCCRRRSQSRSSPDSPCLTIPVARSALDRLTAPGDANASFACPTPAGSSGSWSLRLRAGLVVVRRHEHLRGGRARRRHSTPALVVELIFGDVRVVDRRFRDRRPARRIGVREAVFISMTTPLGAGLAGVGRGAQPGRVDRRRPRGRRGLDGDRSDGAGRADEQRRSVDPDRYVAP